MLVVTQTSADGTSARSLCTQDGLFARAYVPSTLSGLLRVVDVSLDWGENGTKPILNKGFAKKMIAIRGQSG